MTSKVQKPNELLVSFSLYQRHLLLAPPVLTYFPPSPQVVLTQSSNLLLASPHCVGRFLSRKHEHSRVQVLDVFAITYALGGFR